LRGRLPEEDLQPMGEAASLRPCTRQLRLCLSGLFCHARSASQPCFNTAQLGSELFLLHSSPGRARSRGAAHSWEANCSLFLP
jgi:hypothetical protein